MKQDSPKTGQAPGFTLIELLIGTVIMVIVVIGALSIYSRSNKISADQQQYIDIQNDVRAAMYFIARDLRMAGAGLSANMAGYGMQGYDNETAGTETPDRLKILGSIDEPLVLNISKANGYSGSAATVNLDDFSFEQQPYPDSFYDNKLVLVLPNPTSNCRGAAFRVITQVRHSNPGTLEGFNFSPGGSGFNPPGGLSDVCGDSEFNGGTILIADMREYWLDVVGSKSGLTAGVNGYIGGGAGGVLYMTVNGIHFPLAQNIETLQFQYNGDFNGDASLDGYANWNTAWTVAQIGRIQQVRIMILGRTKDPFASIGKNATTQLHLYRRPAVANTVAATTDDWRKRFLLESSSNIRNFSLNLYNTGQR
jgi:hypothetical protein